MKNLNLNKKYKISTMIKYLLLIALPLIVLTASSPGKKDIPVKKIKLDDLKNMMNADNDTLYIINFWATWCKPCVEEIPYFEKVTKKYEGQKVKVILVSVDYPKHYDSRVLPFVNDNNIQSSVVLLDEKDPNDWMPAVSKSWQGSIPATLIIKGDEKTRNFYEKEFTYTELREIIDNLIN